MNHEGKKLAWSDSISTTTTFTTDTYQWTFKLQKSPLNYNSKKVLFWLKSIICGEIFYVGKEETKFRYMFNNYKSKHRAIGKGNSKVPQKRFHTHYFLVGHCGNDDWDFVIFEQCETHEELKEKETL